MALPGLEPGRGFTAAIREPSVEPDGRTAAPCRV